MARFNLTAGSALEACEQISEQRGEISTMRILHSVGALKSKGGRSPAQRIQDAEQGLKNMEREQKKWFGKRRG